MRAWKQTSITVLLCFLAVHCQNETNGTHIVRKSACAPNDMEAVTTDVIRAMQKAYNSRNPFEYYKSFSPRISYQTCDGKTYIGLYALNEVFMATIRSDYKSVTVEKGQATQILGYQNDIYISFTTKERFSMQDSSQQIREYEYIMTPTPDPECAYKITQAKATYRC